MRKIIFLIKLKDFGDDLYIYIFKISIIIKRYVEIIFRDISVILR